eukprot:COSAG02_NODE_1058_length_14905_cov_7.369882_6_plen_55_part_00
MQDRSKPFVGALVLEQLYVKFKDKWIVELLFDVRRTCLLVLSCEHSRSQKTAFR